MNGWDGMCQQLFRLPMLTACAAAFESEPLESQGGVMRIKPGMTRIGVAMNNWREMVLVPAVNFHMDDYGGSESFIFPPVEIFSVSPSMS